MIGTYFSGGMFTWDGTTSTRTVWGGLGVTPCRIVGFPLDEPESATHEVSGLPDHLVPSQLSCHSGRIWVRAAGQLWSAGP